MKYKIILILFFIAFSCFGSTNNKPDNIIQKKKRIDKNTKKEINNLLNDKNLRNLTVTERMAFYSELFIGLKYDLKCLGDGENSYYDNNPLVNFNKTNCMAYSEHVIALSISDCWENFFNNLQNIRYKNGIISIVTRNHYIMADWLLNNSWLFYDATLKVSPKNYEIAARKISHKDFFNNKKIYDLQNIIEDRTVTINYILKDNINNVSNNFQSGDIFALVLKNKKDIFIGHIIMCFEINNNKVIREASSKSKHVIETSFQLWLETFIKNDRYSGISVIRINDDINRSNMIVLPWEIKK